jgi:hypothetical protein
MEYSGMNLHGMPVIPHIPSKILFSGTAPLGFFLIQDGKGAEDSVRGSVSLMSNGAKSLKRDLMN